MKGIQRLFDDEILSIKENEIEDALSINNLIAMKKIGIFSYNIRFKNGKQQDVILKKESKHLLINGINVVGSSNLKVRVGLLLDHKIFSYDDAGKREYEVYEKIDASLKKYMIYYYGKISDSNINISNLIFKRYHTKNEELNLNIVKNILDNIIEFHSLYYNKLDEVKSMKLNIYTKFDYKKSIGTLKEMFNSCHDDNIKYYGEKRNTKIIDFIYSIDREYEKYTYHRTFTHNDFSTRNIFYDASNILFYDFELACYQNPEHDLMEFLAYEINHFKDDEVIKIIRYYKDNLLKKLNINIDEEEYKSILLFNVYEFVVNRLSLLRLASKKLKIDFIERLLINTNRLIDIVEGKL